MISIHPLETSSKLASGDDLIESILKSLEDFFPLNANDALIFSSKAVSIVQNNIVQFNDDIEKREIISKETKRVLRNREGKRITETHHGFICENAGIEILSDNELLLLPLDPDKAAHSLRLALLNKTSFDLPVIVSSSFYRPFRKGKAPVAIGVSGFKTVDAYCDQLAAAANLLKNSENVLATLIRNIDENYLGNGRAKELLVPKQVELFS